MLRTTSQTLASPKHKMPNKLIAGFAALTTTAIITAGGLAAAATPTHKPTKAQCEAAGFTNYGQCVKEWAHHKNHPGGGYGGGGNTSVTSNISVNLDHSNNNLIKITNTIVTNISRLL